jgi:hypothetical protein
VRTIGSRANRRGSASNRATIARVKISPSELIVDNWDVSIRVCRDSGGLRGRDEL